jgi:hypothetical protein
MMHLSTGSAMLLASMPEDFRLGAFVASEYLQEEHKEYLFALGNYESRRKEGTHSFDKRGVERG